MLAIRRLAVMWQWTSFDTLIALMVSFSLFALGVYIIAGIFRKP